MSAAHGVRAVFGPAIPARTVPRGCQLSVGYELARIADGLDALAELQRAALRLQAYASGAIELSAAERDRLVALTFPSQTPHPQESQHL